MEESSGHIVTDQSASLEKFAPAFVKAQANIETAKKDRANPYFDSKYADLKSVMLACKAALNDNGIAIIQAPTTAVAGRLALKTKLLHESGEWISGTGDIPVGKDGPQAYGSALTYARRYFLAAMVGVCPEDDDAEGASGRTNGKAASVAMTPAERRSVTLAEAFDSRNIPTKARSSATAAVCKKHKVNRITDLPDDKWAELLKAIAAGLLDPKPAQEKAAA